MTSFATASWNRLRRLLRPALDSAPLPAPEPQVLDGMTAVAATEALLAEGAALGAGFPAATGARAWSTRVTDRPVNEFGAPLAALPALGPRAALTSAVGMALAGQRATAFLSGCDLDAAGDVLTWASGQRAPLVVHVALRASAAHAQAIGSGHEAWHAAADRGAVMLMAGSVQEAVDLAVIGRVIAERLLLPVLVGMDGEQVALAAQDVVLPGAELVRAVVGDPADQIDAPSEAQRMLFGRRRRRLPRPFDVERPVLLGPRQGPESWGLAAAGRRLFLDADAAVALDEACDAFAAATDRRCTPLTVHADGNDETIILAQGATVETAVALAARLRRERGRLGVVGVRALRPLPAADLVEAVHHAGTILVVERLDAPLTADGPLLRELRAVLDRCAENDRVGRAIHPGLRALGPKAMPRLVGVHAGLGGLPVRVADLALLAERAAAIERGPVLLGVASADRSPYPKREALADAVRRCAPQLDETMLRSADPAPDVRPEGATTVAVGRTAGGPHEPLAGDAAALLHAVAGGRVRSRAALTWQRFGTPCTDRFVHAPGKAGPLLDPGDDAAADIVLLATPVPAALPVLGPGAAAIVVANGWDDLAAPLRRRLHDAGAEVLVIAPPDDGEGDDPVAIGERLLGGLMTVMQVRLGTSVPGSPKVLAAREAMLEGRPASERERRLEAFRRGMDSLAPLVPDGQAPPTAAAADEMPVPLAVRRLGRREQTLDSLPRFWDQVGVLYHADDQASLTPDPYLSVGAMPPLSSCFRDVGRGQHRLVAFDAAAADGHGSTWTTCPDGSVRPLAIAPRALIDAGIELAAERGRPADALRGIAARMAQRAGKLVAAGAFTAGPAGQLLRLAFAAIADKAADTPERRADLEAAVEAIVDAVGALPVARTAPFFDDAEARASGSGELFSLVIDPDSCKSPELLLSRAGDHGLTAVPRTDENLERARALVRLWERLPDVAGATIERVREHPEVGPLAAMMLSRTCLLAMAGGDGAEAASGAKLALRQVLGAAEFHLQPRLQAHLEQVESLRGRLAETIREVLADSLPTGDLDALAGGLSTLARDDVDLADLSRTLDSAVLARRVDGARLARLVEAARGLADLRWRLAQGPDGLGRARVGMTIAGGSVAAWSAVFPHNPFAAPVAVDAVGEPAALIRGLLEGHLQHMVAGFRLERWAALELDRPQDAARGAEALRGLRFGELTTEERACCPPLLLIGDGEDIGRGLAGLVALLDSGLPVKVVALSGIGGAADAGLATEAQGDYPAIERFDLALLALLGRRAYVAQTSIAAPEHFTASVLAAFAFDGPAFVHVHAPSPQRHGFPITRLHEQARLAIDCRALPLLRYDPAAGGVFGACLDLDGNPSPAEAWHAGADGRLLTPADWAATERRFATHLRPLQPGDGPAVPVAEYLALPADQRAGRTPVATIGGGGDGELSLAVGPGLLEDVEQRGRLWRTLQELAGVVTPFTDRVRAAAEDDLAAAHRDEIERLKSQHEQELAALRSAYEAEAVERVTSGLMALAGYGGEPGRGEGAP
ncbi:MAG: hypothetical protein ACYTJ0_00405 [Planctomycetota bacterium]